MDYSKLTNAELDKLIAEKRNAKIFCDCGKEHCWNDIRENSRDEFLSEYRPTTDPRYAMELLKEMATDKNLQWVALEYQPSILKWKLDMVRIPNHQILSYADTPERAISEAWLQWSENGV